MGQGYVAVINTTETAMRKLIVVTAIVLSSAAAHAEGTKGLTTVASSETSGQPAKPAEPAPAAPPATPSADANAQPRHGDQKSSGRHPKHESNRAWAERRIRSELAKYGID
jgi:hypothetical protein